jgi:hypothetical protein
MTTVIYIKSSIWTLLSHRYEVYTTRVYYVGICKSYKWDNNVVSHTLHTIAQNVKSTKLEFNGKTARGTDCSQNYRNTLATR